MKYELLEMKCSFPTTDENKMIVKGTVVRNDFMGHKFHLLREICHRRTSVSLYDWLILSA